MSDAILDIKRFAERKLSQITPAVHTAYEAVPFEPPAGIYQRTQFVINPPTDPVFSAGFHRENVQFQVFVNAPLNQGTAAVIVQAMKIRDAFKKGTTAVEGSTHCHILRTPHVAGTTIIGDRIICPVIIQITGEVYTT